MARRRSEKLRRLRQESDRIFTVWDSKGKVIIDKGEIIVKIRPQKTTETRSL